MAKDIESTDGKTTEVGAAATPDVIAENPEPGKEPVQGTVRAEPSSEDQIADYAERVKTIHEEATDHRRTRPIGIDDIPGVYTPDAE